MEKKRGKTTDAVEILHRMFVDGDPELEPLLESAYGNAKVGQPLSIDLLKGGLPLLDSAFEDDDRNQTWDWDAASLRMGLDGSEDRSEEAQRPVDERIANSPGGWCGELEPVVAP
jgi:hypothetical protein